MSAIPEGSNVTVLNKNEKKAREMISKLGLKKIAGINRVTFRKKDNQIFAIDNPEVYRSQGGNYVVFGEAKIDNFSQKLAAAQEKIQSVSKSPEEIQKDMQLAADQAGDESAKPAAAAEEDDEAPVDAGDLSAEDIELVASQANVSKNKAIKALKEHNGDIVNAIMALSK
ncbi:hypothetical protein Kpol_1028p76 [Vanderwaltozyma polyspora DSM 70294]|uniref:Nascent polypeptide-associated complex subunit alpha n=1 Tax=Vanderwaltozyma polyspora (strain ATCC 22028 / DSM 70294 / BCRC 21397 / CBS 2163 / NBRC 10782 / NRRL Y-8283 / UCD 57-17) TaxID=436907 RepID=NACA_VANPO|nr:uncharacterized protein Kpol_1028p76 [Vanderwaltozyma polyspora DSM 70294]A7TG43.1 RecName: Full=Nascent polypeptide-associated complex subunit alpha; Short=NAC-alpha; AltName: Full=Alpha-NAC [Vanderwaltozyma polyspora DSM 70294]EDO18800.1 hypothetical protein Kpol_1028p76 [Vanderwaltozyma polyspora DSM 70294]